MFVTVQPGDTPAILAQRFTGSAASAPELILANPGKPRQIIQGQVTFATLRAGERLKLPPSWMKKGLRGLPQGFGVAANDALAGTIQPLLTSLGNGCSDPGLVSAATNFQTQFEAVYGVGTAGGVDGLYGTNTASALQTAINAYNPAGQPSIQSFSSGSAPAACVGAAPAPSPGPSPAPGPTPAPGPATPSSNKALVVGGIVAAAAVAALAYVAIERRRHAATMTVSGRPVMGRRPMGRPMVRARARRR